MTDEDPSDIQTTAQAGGSVAPLVSSRARNRQVSENLRETSRALSMQSGSRRAMYRTLGLRPRRMDVVFRVAFVAAFLIGFALPLGAGLAYFGLMVTPQYEAETRFVLRSALPVLSNDSEPSDANVASLKIVQDTLVVISFLESPALVQRLDDEIDLDAYYARPEIDPLSRLTAGQSLEDKTAYFGDFITASVSSVSGIVTVKVRAFTAQEAQDVLNAVFLLAEERVNLLNQTIWASVFDVADRNFAAASDQLRAVRDRYAQLQNETGVFDIELEAEALSDVITTLRTELIDLENRRSALRLEVPETHITVQRLTREIGVRSTQLSQLEDDVASARTDGVTLSGNQQLFDALEVEIDVAQDRFKTAALELEQAKMLNSTQLLYLDRFVRASLPQDSTYPNYLFEIARLLVLCLMVWGAAVLVLTTLQKRLD